MLAGEIAEHPLHTQQAAHLFWRPSVGVSKGVEPLRQIPRALRKRLEDVGCCAHTDSFGADG